uniref:7TM_GPCR_Srx domain-containing protein n=1 Tax=Strongyloides stercoralis TaxID=6248 RepID=A0A0K0E8Q3_STRER
MYSSIITKNCINNTLWNYFYGMDNETILWYLEPLHIDDIFAGSFLLIFGSFFIFFYSLVSYVMFKSDKDVIGFRFLFSASIADILIIFNYSIWPGLTILLKSEIITYNMRHWVQMYLDWVWFSMCYHYMVIAWSRFAAIRFPNTFRIQKRVLSYSICLCCYIFAFIQVLTTHFQPWYVVFYFEPSHYGMLSEDFVKYLTEGQSLFFITFHILMVIIPIFFYTYGIILLLRHKHVSIFEKHKTTIKQVKNSRSVILNTNIHHSNIEARLIFPCLFNTIVFIIGQIVITLGTGEGKWATWTVLILFAANSAVNPILLIVFSTTIRQKMIKVLGFDKQRSKKMAHASIAVSFTHPKAFSNTNNKLNASSSYNKSIKSEHSYTLSINHISDDEEGLEHSIIV